MSGALGRLLRLRALAEEQARLEAEAAAARLGEVERAAAGAALEARASRERWFAEIGGGSGGVGRLAEESAWELAVRRRATAEAKRPAAAAELDRARGEFLRGRRERMQVETLVEAAAAAGRREADRREQRLLDDWHQSRPRRAAADDADGGSPARIPESES